MMGKMKRQKEKQVLIIYAKEGKRGKESDYMIGRERKRENRKRVILI